MQSVDHLGDIRQTGNPAFSDLNISFSRVVIDEPRMQAVDQLIEVFEAMSQVFADGCSSSDLHGELLVRQ